MRIATTLAAGLLALTAATTVLGHAAPERFDPAPGAVLDAAPDRVDGWFIQDVRRQEEASFIKVFDADGNQVDDGAPVIDDADRRHLYVNLTSSLDEGRYMVAWQTLSDEDDELDGSCFLFFVGQAAADEAHEARSRIDVAGKCPTAAVSAPPEATASIELDVPEESATGDVSVGLSTEGATIRLPTGEGRDPAFAHYHLYLDVAPQLLHSHEAEDGEEMDMEQDAFSGDIMTTADSHAFKNLEPGTHTVFAALFYDDHTPFNPSVITGTTFRVAGSDGGDGGGDTWVPIVVGVAALAVGGGLGFALRRR